MEREREGVREEGRKEGEGKPNPWSELKRKRYRRKEEKRELFTGVYGRGRASKSKSHSGHRKWLPGRGSEVGPESRHLFKHQDGLGRDDNLSLLNHFKLSK